MKYLPGNRAYRNLIFVASTLLGNIADAQTIDTGDWLKISVPAKEVVALPKGDLLLLDAKGFPSTLDTVTNKRKKLPGRFTRLARSWTGIPWALSTQGKLYFLRNSVWRQIEIDIAIDDFSLGEKSIFIISQGKIREFNFQGEAVPNDTLSNYANVTKFFQIKENVFVRHMENGIVLLSKDGKEKVLDKNIEKILSVEKDFISTKNYQGAINFHVKTTTGSPKKFVAVNSANISSITVSETGTLWAIGLLGIFRAPFVLDDLEDGRDARALERKLLFKKSKISALRLFAGQDGVFRLTTTGGLNLWSPKKRTFVPFPGRVTELAVSGDGELWGLNSLGRIFHFEDEEWRQQQGLAVSISARFGEVLIVDNKGLVKRYDRRRKVFKSTKFRRVEMVFVQNPRVFWILKDRGKIFRCNPSRCVRIGGKARRLAISPEGVVFAISFNSKLLRYNGRRFVGLKTPAKAVRDVAAWLNGTPWIIDEKNMVHVARDKRSPFTDFKDREAFEVGTEAGDTVGQGKALLGRFELMLFDLRRSADAPNSGFVFRKNFKWKKIKNTLYFMDLSMGRDGRLWGLTTADVYQYHERTKSFKQYTAANFKSRKQEFLKLPSGVTASSIISDSEQKIWVVKKNSKWVYYQEKRKGAYRSTKIKEAPVNITDITVDVAGTVYVAAQNIYRKRPRDRRFKLFLKQGKRPFRRLSAGPAGTLWAVAGNSSGSKSRVHELVGGKLVKRPRKKKAYIGGQDVDISVEGTVYVTGRTDAQGPNVLGSGNFVSPSTDVRCRLKKWNPRNRSLDLVTKLQRAQYVAVARDGTPWITCAPSGNGTKDVFHAAN